MGANLRHSKTRLRAALYALALATLASLGGFAAGAVASPPAKVAGLTLATTAGARLVLTWSNSSPLGFQASPCYKPGEFTDVCNATYWVNKDPNGTCVTTGTAQWITGLSYTASTKFYFAGSNPTFPTDVTFCGGGSTAVSVQFWFHVNPGSGVVAGKVSLSSA